METEQIANLTIHRSNDYEEIHRRAYQQSVQTLGDVIPVVLFRQGSRYSLCGALPFGTVSKVLYSQSAERKSSIASTVKSTNRPEIKEHTDEIAKYIEKNYNDKYTLGSLTLNIQQPLTLYTYADESAVKIAYLILPRTAKIAITDGQHRQSAIKRVLDQVSPEEAQRFALESIAVVITNEMDPYQIHQDFADASKTKALPPGLLAVYDSRNPANRIVIDLERECPLLKGRVDATSKSISKKSGMLFTANQLRQFVKVFLTGNWQMGNDVFERTAFNTLRDENYKIQLNIILQYINALTTAIPVWSTIADLAPGIPGTRVNDLREQGYACLSVAGLVVLAKIGHELFKYEKDWQKFVSKIGSLDWSKDGELWVGNIVSSKRTILSGQHFVRAAIEKTRAAIGLKSEELIEM